MLCQRSVRRVATDTACSAADTAFAAADTA